MVPLAGSQPWGRCSRLGYAKPHCQHSQDLPPQAGTPPPAPAAPLTPGPPGKWLSLNNSPRLPAEDALPAAPSWAAPLPTAIGLGGLCQWATEALMVLCLALNYSPNCHHHVLASGPGCDPGEPGSTAAAWGANGRSTPHVEFNYWLSSLTEYIG